MGSMLSAFSTYNGLAPEQGPKAIRVNVDFTLSNTFEFDLAKEQDANQIGFLQSVYVDNSENATPITMYVKGVPFTLVIPAFSTGMFPVIHTGHFSAVVTSPNLLTNLVQMVFLNVPQPYYVTSRTNGISAIVLNNDFALDNVATMQPAFGLGAAGELQVYAGTYQFYGIIAVSGMDVVSGNTAFNILGSGTATIGFNDALFAVRGAESVGVATVTGFIPNAIEATPNVVAVGVTPNVRFAFEGVFRVQTAGTIIPSLTLVTASPTATVLKNSNIRIERLGPFDMEKI